MDASDEAAMFLCSMLLILPTSPTQIDKLLSLSSVDYPRTRPYSNILARLLSHQTSADSAVFASSVLPTLGPVSPQQGPKSLSPEVLPDLLVWVLHPGTQALLPFLPGSMPIITVWQFEHKWSRRLAGKAASFTCAWIEHQEDANQPVCGSQP